LNILFVADSPLHQPVSGLEQVLYQQATGLVRRGLNVSAVTRRTDRGGLQFRDICGVRNGCYGADTSRPASYVLSLLRHPRRVHVRLTAQSAIDLVIAHQATTYLALRLFARVHRHPLIYIFHSPWHEEYLLQDHPRQTAVVKHVSARIRLMAERLCLHSACKIVVLSRYMKRKLIKLHSLAADRIDVNPGGADLDRFSPPPGRDALKRALGLNPRTVNLLTVRNLEPRMGLDNLLQAFELITRRCSGVHLVIGGEGPEKQRLGRLITRLNIADKVTLTGFIPSTLLPQYYGAADFFIVPSRRLEGFGLVTPEAMACGTPVLGTPVGGTREILEPFDARFLFHSHSPEAISQGTLAAIASHPPESQAYRELRARCRRYAVKKYSWRRHVEQLQSLLEATIGAPHPV